MAELFLDAKEISKVDIPVGLLERFSQNLFRDIDWKTNEEHPISNLLDKLASVSKLKIANVEIEKNK